MLDRRSLLKRMAAAGLSLAAAQAIPEALAEPVEPPRRFWSLDRTMSSPLVHGARIALWGEHGEVALGGYARAPVTFAPASNGRTANSATIVFPEPTGDWGMVWGGKIVNGRGQEIFSFALDRERFIHAYDCAPAFAPGALTVELA